MSISEHGIEGLRKATSYVTSGLSTETKLRTFNVSGMISESYDFVDASQISSLIDSFVFKTGGSGGTTVATVIITYTDSTKNYFTVAKT